MWPDTSEATSPPSHALVDLVENVGEGPCEVDVIRTPNTSHAIPAHLRHILWPDTGEAAAPLPSHAIPAHLRHILWPDAGEALPQSPPSHVLADLVENAESGSLESIFTTTWRSTLAKQQLFPSYAYDKLVATLWTTQGGRMGT
ncbi:hypothetical protein H257_05232 [Aphanomyces astaci]|uniref:Uncharacterized protein n=1 Tax=Aphanomyces astaci TaxID=112090 RepID=W4GUT1_APHAT|nr:hypothetical protein H257_05232 [Aphanomyces astaci]ETV82663.1 hypothetical protein H257_05232 [Aphanomyces astaci]|eukprot:XP_009828332.1 hypothetical protein H257_05232 [Aphanomyces astaci]